MKGWNLRFKPHAHTDIDGDMYANADTDIECFSQVFWQENLPVDV